MEIRAFAERLLFTEDLDEKLAPPGRLTDLRPQGPEPTLHAPGRPVALRFSNARAPFPSPAAVERPRARGQVLHFFANHELLAMELMALVLLRFPEAPPAFRRGLVRTIAEEQGHLRLYLARMATCGVELGEIPVNGFFWSCMADAPSPLDFVARMSLVFEQANLDHSLLWSRAFRAAGDAETADVLDLVYREEIGHVRFGLAWFDRWRDPELSLWEAWTRRLSLPLDSSRARGAELDRPSREAAGLPRAFVDALAVHRRSKGRPPVVWRFDPDVEAEVARGRPGHSSSRAVEALARDLETLPALLAAPDDVVLVRRTPDPAFLVTLADAGLPLPEIATSADPHPKLGGLRPWGWSPDAERRLAPLRARLIRPEVGWRDELAELSSKAWAAEHAAALDPDTGGRVCRSVDEVTAAIGAFGCEVLAKLPFSTSGQGRRRFGPPSYCRSARSGLPRTERSGKIPRALLDDAGLRWLRNALDRQGALVVEPWLDRVLDLSLQFTVSADGAAAVDGLVRFFTDRSGRFRGCVVGPADAGLPPELRRFLHGDGHVEHGVERVLARTAGRLAPEMAARGFVGPAGIDAMVHRAGGLRLKPLVELNPRLTMGRIALALRRRVRGEALWLLLGPGDARAAGHPTLAALGRHLRERHPVRRYGGRIADGVLATNDVERAEVCLSVLVVGPALRSLPAPLDPRVQAAGPGTGRPEPS